MAKVVINTCYGGFGLSQAALERLRELGSAYVGEWSEEEQRGLIFNEGKLYLTNEMTIPRHDTLLVQVVEELGVQANRSCADLVVVTIPGTLYRVGEYDGKEWVETPETLDWVDAGLPVDCA